MKKNGVNGDVVQNRLMINNGESTYHNRLALSVVETYKHKPMIMETDLPYSLY